MSAAMRITSHGGERSKRPAGCQTEEKEEEEEEISSALNEKLKLSL